MNTPETTFIESQLKQRKIEFLEKLRDLLSDYNAVVDKYTGDEEHFIVTDGHLKECWESLTTMEEINEDNLQIAIDKLKAS